MGKFDEFARHYFFKSVNFGDTVADFDNRPDFIDGHTRNEIFDLLPDNFVNFVGFYTFHIFMLLN